MEQYVCHILTSFSALPDKIFERDNQKRHNWVTISVGQKMKLHRATVSKGGARGCQL